MLKRPKALILKLFKNQNNEQLTVANYQEEIIRKVYLKEHRRLIVIAATQSGKSEAIAIGLILSAVFNPGEEIVSVSATFEQAGIIFNYVRRHLGDHKLLTNEVSRMTQDLIEFNNGSKIKILSAGGSSKGEQLLGHTATTLVIDESGSIEDEIYKTKILRMLGAEKGRKKILIEVGTPHIKNHFYDSWISNLYYKIKVNWEMAVSEGRLDRVFVEEQKITMTALEFSMWYEADFPEESEDQLFKLKELDDASNNEMVINEGYKMLGVDVARFGVDLTVATYVIKDGDKHEVKYQVSWDKKDTMQTVGRIMGLNTKDKFNQIKVDDVGVGGGVTDRLRELDVKDKVLPVNAGEAPKYNTKSYLNVKAEMYFNLKKLFENRLIRITKDNKLRSELLKIRFENTSSGKIKIIDPQDKSPDYADSLAIACYNIKKCGLYGVDYGEKFNNKETLNLI